MTEIAHSTVQLSTGISMHVAEAGSGPAVVMCHGFPELWYSWRHQIPALAEAGFRAIAPDMRGYGGTDAPDAIEDYTLEAICADMAALLDALGEETAVFVGHDWGGAVVWNMAQHHPDRVRAVAGINTPASQRAPMNPLDAMKMDPGRFDYQLYFQEPGVAEAELSANVRRVFTLLLRTSKPVDGMDALAGTAGVRERGGLFVGAPETAPRSIMLTEEDLDTFVETFERTGFRGGLNWYRNHGRNWEWSGTLTEESISQPALMVTAGRDPVLLPAMTHGMEDWIPNLSRGHIEECGHWTQQEEPEALNKILLEWLGGLPRP
jgi:soluble epoxide hydrolase/lipid-phosphate phosphatase